MCLWRHNVSGNSKTYLVLHDWKQIWILWTDFYKNLRYQILRKSVLWEPRWYMRIDRRTDCQADGKVTRNIYMISYRNISAWYLIAGIRRGVNDIDIFVNCSWVDTRWQQYSTHLHTNNTQNNTIKTLFGRPPEVRTQSGQTNWEECGPCPVFASYTLQFALQLRKKVGKTSVRVAEECQSARWKQNIQNRTYITMRIHKHNIKNT